MSFLLFAGLAALIGGLPAFFRRPNEIEASWAARISIAVAIIYTLLLFAAIILAAVARPAPMPVALLFIILPIVALSTAFARPLPASTRAALISSLTAVILSEIIYPLTVWGVCAYDNRQSKDSWQWRYHRGEFLYIDTSRAMGDSTYDGRITLCPPFFSWHS